MKLKLKLQNFKCWDSKTIEFEDGLSLISGTSGIGKTSLLDAVYFVLFKSGYKVLKIGKKNCSVSLIIDDSLVITRSKRPERLTWKENKVKYEDEVAQKHIYNRFGIYTDKLCYLKQDNMESFIYMKPGKKLEFIESILFKDIDMSKIKKKVKDLQLVRQKKLSEIQSNIEVVKNLIKDQSLPVCEFPLESKSDSLQEKEKDIQQFYKENDDLTETIENSRLKLLSLHKKSNELKFKKLRLDENKQNLRDCQKKLEALQFDKNRESTLQTDYQKSKNEYELSREQEELLQSHKLLEKQLTQSKQKYKEHKKESILLDEKLGKYLSDKEYNLKIDELRTIIQYKKEYNKKQRKVERIRENLSTFNNISVFTVEQLSTKIQDLQQTLKCETEFLSCPSCNQALKYKNSILVKIDESKIISTEEKRKLKLECETFFKDREEIKKQLHYKQNLEHEFKLISNEVEKLSKKISEERKLEECETKVSELNQQLKNRENIQREQRYAYRTYKRFKDDVNAYKNKIKPIAQKLTELKITKSESTLLDTYHTAKKKLDVFLQTKSRYNELTQREIELKNKMNRIDFKPEDLEDSKKRITILEKNVKELEVKHGENKILKEKCEKWLEYYRRYKQLEHHRRKEDELKKKEKEACIQLKGTLEIHRKIKYLSSYVLTSSIKNLNTLLDEYIQVIFPKKTMKVELSSFKKKKDQSKPQINILINGEYDKLDLLSGGERQRINIAMTFAMMEHFNIPFLLLDECTSNLDQELATGIVSMIKNKNFKKPILMIAHQAIEGIFDHIKKIE